MAATMFFGAVGCTTPAFRIEVFTVGPERVVLPLVVPVGTSASSTGMIPSIASPSLEAIVTSAPVAFATSLAVSYTHLTLPTNREV